MESNHSVKNNVLHNHENKNKHSKNQLKVESIRFHLSFKTFAITTVCLPLLSLLFCFVTAMIFQFDSVNHTFCKVKNFIPSISAITGITPQRYVWRICIALHSTPRFVIAVMYWNYFKAHIHNINPKDRGIYMRLVTLNFWLNVVENSCLVGVTYISNVENYPLHEKVFIVFMVTSILYMLMCTYLFKWCQGTNPSPLQVKSLQWKRYMLAVIILSTIGLLMFFYKHRVFCEPGAYSKFSACEYVVVLGNITFHGTMAWDFKGRDIIAAIPIESHPTENGRKQE